MPACLLALAVFAAPAPAPAQPPALPRAASVSLCADHYLTALAAPGQIASLSFFSKGPMAAAPVKPRSRFNHADPEELLALRPDIVIMETYGHRPLARILRRFDIPVVRINPDGAGFDAIAANIRRVGQALRQSEKAEAMIARTKARFAALARPAKLKRALYLRPGGGSAGPGTYIDFALRAAGLDNQAARYSRARWPRASLETLLRDPPDIFVLSFFGEAGVSFHNSFSRHPVFRRLAARRRQISVPARYWVCASPFLIDAAETIARQAGDPPS